uniref:Uncharacterized protein n=1 Tax=Acrobeloides nanus TaxID=290746 RepID=A0A914BXZ2_9BILA
MSYGWKRPIWKKEANGKMFWIRGYMGREKCEKNRNSDRRSKWKGSIKGEVIREQHPIGPLADRELGQGGEAFGTFTYPGRNGRSPHERLLFPDVDLRKVYPVMASYNYHYRS